MDITERVAHNLSALIDSHPTLDTLKKVAAASGVGFGTVRRALGREPGNITVQNLEALAKAFGKKAEDLLAEPKSGKQPQVNQPSVHYLPDEAHRVPARLARMSDAELDKLLSVLNMIDNFAVGATATPTKKNTPGWNNLPAGDPEQQPADKGQREKTGQ